jgi:hypothetical protein
MTRFLAVSLGCMLISTAHAAEPPSSCQGLLSDPDVYGAVKDAVVYTMVFNQGSRASSDKIFSDLGYWLDRKLIWLEDEPTLLARLQKIISEIDNADVREKITNCYPGLDKFLHPAAAKQAEAVKQAEAAERAEAAKLAETAKRTEATKSMEAAARQALEAGAPAQSKLEEAARQAWKAGVPARAAEAAKEAELAKRAEEAARHAREAEAPKQAEAAKRAEEAASQAREAQVQLEEAARQAWAAAAPARAAETAKLAEAEKQAKAAKQTEDARQVEEATRQAREADAQSRAQEEKTRIQEEYILKVAYADYTIVKRCHDKREWGYISEPQLAEAQAALSEIKKPNIDLDALQKRANTLADDLFFEAEVSKGHPTDPVERLCNGALAELMHHDWWDVPEEAQK